MYRVIFCILYMYVLYSTLLHLPPLRFHCVGGCWDRAQDSCDFGVAIRRSSHLATTHPRPATSHDSHPHTATSHPPSATSHPHSASSHPHSATSHRHSAASHPHSAASHPHSAASHPHSATSHPLIYKSKISLLYCKSAPSVLSLWGNAMGIAESVERSL